MAVTVIDTGNPRIVSRSIEIDAPAEVIFDLLADPRRHPDFDGSGSVREGIEGPQRLSLGSKFRMRMCLGVPYVISNTVKEFDEPRRIAWAHFGGHRWRYQLEEIEGGGTRVTETFDASRVRAPIALRLMDAFRRNAESIEQTLPRLKRLAEENNA